MQIPWWLIEDFWVVKALEAGHCLGVLEINTRRLARPFRCLRCGRCFIFKARIDAEGQSLSCIGDDGMFDPCPNKFSRQLAA